MSTNAIQSTTPSAASTPSLGGALGREDFLKILMVQLQNQDPLNPMNDREFVAQMAQLSTLEATQGLSGQVQDLVFVQQQTQALQMVGREVEYLNPQGAVSQGKVGSVRLDTLPPSVVIGEHEVPVNYVFKVL